MISEKMPTWEQNRASGHCGAERLKNVDAFASIHNTNVDCSRNRADLPACSMLEKSDFVYFVAI